MPSTILDFKEMWRTHFRIETQAEQIRQKLQQNPVFTLKNAFEVLDYHGQGIVTVNDLKRLIEQKTYPISDKEAF